MSLLERYECTRCYKYTGWPGLMSRRDPLRRHLACVCGFDEPEARAKAEKWTAEFIAKRLNAEAETDR